MASNQDNICLTSFNGADDVMMTSSRQNKGIHGINSTPTTRDPPEGKTMAVIAVMRGKPKDGCHHCRSNKHYKQKNSAGPVRQKFWRWLHLCEQRQTHTASLLKKAGSTAMEYFKLDLPDKA